MAPRPLRVAQLCTYDRAGGAAIAALRLTEALRRVGEDATLVVLESTAPHPHVQAVAAGPFARKLAKGRLLLEKLRLKRHDRTAGRELNFAFSTAEYGVDVSRLPAVRNADVLHLHWINNAFISLEGLRALGKLGKPVVWTLHDMWAFTGGCHYSGDCEGYAAQCGHCPMLARPAPDDLSHRVWLRKAAAYAELDLRFVSCSGWLADTALRSPLLNGRRPTVLPNPLDTDVFRPQDRDAARRALGLPTDKTLLLFGSAKLTDPRKGFQFLADALKSMGPDAPAALVFGKADMAAFPDTEKYYLGNLTRDEDLARAYAAADALALPTLADNLPNTVAEAMACGRPAVAFRTGGVPEMITHEVDGYLTAAPAADALTEGIRYLLEDPARYRRLAGAARARAVETYGYATLGARFAAYYRAETGRRPA